MNTAFKLLHHAIGLLTCSPLVTARVVAPAVILMAGIGIITALVAPEMLLVNMSNPDIDNASISLLPVVLLAAFILSYALMAILWHRHTLCARLAPEPMTARLLCGYVWRVIMLALIQLGVSLILVTPLMLADHSASGNSPSIYSILLTTFVTQLVLVWLSLRLSLILPAAALGRPITLGHSWNRTSDLSRPLWGVAAMLALLNTVLTVLMALFGPLSPGYALVLELPIYVIEGLLIFSVLTTLYAQLIQKSSHA